MATKRKIIRLGSRGSPLALAQAGLVTQDILRFNSGLDIETIVIETSGDRFAPESARMPLEPSPGPSGIKGLFVKEIEEALLAGRIDLAVHSAKDLPMSLAGGLIIGAYPEREDPRDAFIGRDGRAWEDLPAAARIGTSSLRRELQILRAKPQAVIAPLRGNIDTRLGKIQTQGLDGIVLAVAGLRRLGKENLYRGPLSPDIIVPAPGQGALAVEIRGDDADMAQILKPLDHFDCRVEVECERAFSAAVGGGCSSPVGALARVKGGALTLQIFWSAGENSPAACFKRDCPDVRNARAFALEVAGELSR